MGSGSRKDPATGRTMRETAKLGKSGRAGALKREGGKVVERRIDRQRRDATGRGAIRAENARRADRDRSWRAAANQSRARSRWPWN